MINFFTSPIDAHSATLITFEVEGGVTTPEEAFAVELPKVQLDKGVILSGRGPIWFFARLIHHYHPARWIAVHDPRIGYIVVQSHCKERYEGEVLAQ
ncbi:MAG: CRISPR-associated ring nuclease Crn3/Csx3 [Campylobacterales bacterium]|nr:CRISPR-associated ring nuclease Crn3/Csx3 [Campylobacterales bacterium]